MKELAKVGATVGSLVSAVSYYNLYLVGGMTDRLIESRLKLILLKISLFLLPLVLYVGYFYNYGRVLKLTCGSEKSESLAMDAIDTTVSWLRLTFYLLAASITILMSTSICYQDLVTREEEAEL